MKPRRARQPVALDRCPNCGVRLMPTPKEMKEWRQLAGLSKLDMAAHLGISPAYITYLENGVRSPSASVIARYRKFSPK